MRRRFHVYQQLESTDCGVACVRMLAHYFGKRIPADILRKSADINRAGLTVKDIVVLCDTIGLQATPISLQSDKLSQMPLPVVFH